MEERKKVDELERVARTGFEPVISALRGQCPWPLDERATLPEPQSNGLAYQSPTTNPWLCPMRSRMR